MEMALGTYYEWVLLGYLMVGVSKFFCNGDHHQRIMGNTSFLSQTEVTQIAVSSCSAFTKIWKGHFGATS
jgi:hypothetical protein